MKIQNKLFLVLFGFSFLLVTILVLLMQWSLGKGMINYVNTKEVQILQPLAVQLAEEYKEDNSWLSMDGQNDKFRHLITNQLKGSEFIDESRLPPQPRRGMRPPQNDADSKYFRKARNDGPPGRRFRPPQQENEAYYALLDQTENVVAGMYLDDLDYTKTAIELNGVTIGFLAISKRNRLTNGYEIDFIEQQQNYLWVIALMAMSLVTLVTLPLARNLVEPIKLISRSMHQLTQGNYKQSVQLTRRDELGQMARDYNELALTLAENDTARKRWLANISHELRTPVAILRGELEAMLDNVRPLSKDNISSANDEVKHLQRLIDDLNLLTSADVGGMRYRKQDEELTHLILNEEQKYQSYLATAGIKLNLNITDQEIDVYIDKTRLYQLFENVINNCIKYSYATELTISLSVEHIGDKQFAVLTFEDNGIGVEEVHLAHLFEHLYRVEESRNRKTGGAGLGLAICRLIVIAHQGEVTAQHSKNGGLSIVIKLPIVIS
ncbi:two-component sensor histidine kinase [Psychrosphaera saromensis]|uniref:histidine kinase n=1 Tax=Psychrosphaera saromensis TaxID=716813 RepID=A0A2S7UTG0_9GAMM|nr:ATP-binding protein [Psychrosphaera saromensis]PQJ52560.1 two-component sensor histidine kinase [Psychrosphaera saromensis]GHB69453.1 two-component sensor histidine kinase [Psychrosphaera saromensis]GLQ13030.1 two-component sensor histidine kinase [Psychrosphaera saromensis]